MAIHLWNYNYGEGEVYMYIEPESIVSTKSNLPNFEHVPEKPLV